MLKRWIQTILACAAFYALLFFISATSDSDDPQPIASAYSAAATAELTSYPAVASQPGAMAPSPEYVSTAQPFYAAPVGGCAENGSCYGDLSYETGRAKTVEVQGYTRSDGTYVRGHYRSPPR
jgi:hypothetical protein